MRVDAVEFPEAVRRIVAWAEEGRGRTVCAANVHMVMEAWDDPSFRAVVNGADLVVPDGQPLVWALRLAGAPQRARVRAAPDLVLALLHECARRGLRAGLYGGAPDVLADLAANARRHVPGLRLVYEWSPPFRPLTAAEDETVVGDIRAAGVQLLLVGLGCPKQERWMAAHRERLPCVMVGVGAAFDMLAGRTGNAPRWLRGAGLEWVYRLLQEPRRLWRRYLWHNPRFLVLLARETLRRRGRDGAAL
jgi:N-acetylglucosaminyldiphosphoundecaprenol N-acetyl-beta-D-mannosaminyltransferase